MKSKGKVTSLLDSGRIWEGHGKKFKVYNIKILDESGTEFTGTTMSEKFTLGETADYERTETQYGNQFKYVDDKPQYTGKGSGRDEDAMHRRTALMQAVQKHEGIAPDETVLKTADIFYTWLKK